MRRKRKMTLTGRVIKSRAKKMNYIEIINSVYDAAKGKSPARALLASGINARKIKGLKMAAGHLLKVGYTARDLRMLGFTSNETMRALYSFGDPKLLTVKSLKNAGASAAELLITNPPKKLRKAGFSEREIEIARRRLDLFRSYRRAEKIFRRRRVS